MSGTSVKNAKLPPHAWAPHSITWPAAGVLAGGGRIDMGSVLLVIIALAAGSLPGAEDLDRDAARFAAQLVEVDTVTDLDRNPGQ